MKKLGKYLAIVIFACLAIFIHSLPASAASATVGFQGNSTVEVGKNITITMYISDVTDTDGGVVSAGGNLKFDSNYLEYVSATGISTPYQFQINPNNNYIIAGLDTTLSNGIQGSSATTVFTFVFKAKQKGTTTVTLENAKLSDASKKITANVSGKVINIIDSSASTELSNDATLNDLKVEGYELSPSFSKDNTNYTVKVPSNVSSVKVSGSTSNNKASASGFGDINLTGDKTTVTITVTAEDKSTKTYTITIEKDSNQGTTTPGKSSDATLKSLDVSGYTLMPSFSPNVNSYTIQVQNTVDGLNVSAIPNSDKARVEISGNHGWKDGINTITIKVIAEDGTTNIYLVNANRASKDNQQEQKSSDNYLKDLIINSSHEMSPEFNKDTSNYNITVPNEVDHLELNAIPNSPQAKVEIKNNENFKIGSVNTVEIVVTAEDGSMRVYTLNVTRSTVSAENDLEDLEIDAPLSPSFDPNQLEYTTSVDSNTDKLNINAVAKNKDATVEIIGNENLKPGKNTILIKVTDKNGFSKVYQIEVEKEAKKTLLFGLTGFQLGMILLGLIGLAFLIWLFIFLAKRRKKDEPEPTTENINPPISSPIPPVIEIKPEFNFGSKNNSDDDVVHGNLNQDSRILSDQDDEEEKYIDADYEDVTNKVPFDYYDETITKDEIVAAIREATETKDPSKLKMLLDQDELNQRKKRMKEEEKRRKEVDEDEL